MGWVLRGKKKSKYGNKKVWLDGFRFDSKAEAARWTHLKLLQSQGYIADLERQVSYTITVNEKKICRYVADFRYRITLKLKPGDFSLLNNEIVVEDVKGARTPIYRLKKKLMEAVHGIKIVEPRVQPRARVIAKGYVGYLYPANLARGASRK